MHSIIAVIHKKDVDVDKLFSRFVFENYNYMTYEETFTNEQMLERIENIKKQEDSEWKTEFLENIEKCKTEEEKIKFYADFENFTQDHNGNWGLLYNPYGECDWFTIGGRWSGSLVNWQGEGKDTIKIQDFNIDNQESIKNVYGVLYDYLGEDEITYLEEDKETEEWRKIVQEALDYSEQYEVDLYITLVDMHF